MGLFKLLRKNFLLILIVGGIFTYIVNIYFDQEEKLEFLAQEKQKVEHELELARDYFDRISAMEKRSNSSDSKETEIRERLNMIKRDEIQFLFGKE